MLSVEDLVVVFEDHRAVDGVSLTVSPGEIVCVLGASGSGKSTLLRTIAGLEHPQSGTVRWDGRDVTSVPVHERGFGLVFQDFALFPHRDVAGNVGFGVGGDEMRIADALSMVGLAGYERRQPSTLSGGEAQRVAVARALAPRPDVLLLDEPLGSLDRPLRERLTVELRRLLHDLEVAAIHVTHDQQEALAIADRVVLLRDGRVVQDGTPVDVWRQPADVEVARFLGFSNLVPVDGGVRVIPPDAVSLAIDGEAGIVREIAFRGIAFTVTVDLDAGWSLDVPAPAHALPEVGERVFVSIDDELTTTLPE